MLSFPSTVRKMKFSMKDFFSKCSQIHRKLWIWSNLLKEFLMGNFISCSVMCKVKTFLNQKAPNISKNKK